MKNVKKLTITVILAIATLLISVWVIAIAKCEYLTSKYGQTFEHAYIGHTMFRTPDSFKVIDYTDTMAKVYYSSRGCSGDIVYYRRNTPEGSWVFDRWETVWSSSGSADSFIWPYIR